MNRKFMLDHLTVLGIVITSLPVLAVSASAAEWSFPFQAGKTVQVTNGSHFDYYTNSKNARDYGLSAGDAVLLPVDATVLAFCKTGVNGDHHAIQLAASDGQKFSLIHVKTSGLSKGQSFKKGSQIGVVAADTPWDNCAQSTAKHLHFAVANADTTIDGIRAGDISGSVTSKNGAVATPTPPPTNNGIVSVSFTAVTGQNGANVRNAPSTSGGFVKSFGANQRLSFDAWTFGTAVMDTSVNPPAPDARWYRLAGTGNQWVSSSVVIGNAPNSRPMP